MVKSNTALGCAYRAPFGYLHIHIHVTTVQTYTNIYDKKRPIPQSNLHNTTKAELVCAPRRRQPSEATCLWKEPHSVKQ